MRIETAAVHAGNEVNPMHDAVMPPIVLTTTFRRNADGTYPHGYVYSRSENPNRSGLEACLCQLERGAAAAAFASGQAATMAVFQALAQGDHVLIPDNVYFGTGALATSIFQRWGLVVDVVDMTDLAAVRGACQSTTRLVWIETPSNPLLRVTDIAGVCQIAHEAGAQCVVDNTWSTPVLQQPLTLGADLVVHATTKYLGGHSDLLGGAVIAKSDDEFFARIRTIQTLGGAVPSPFDCWLLLRSIRTLPYRVRAHCEHAMQVARFLQQHPKIAAIHYPGLAEHLGHHIAASQMPGGYGGMLSVQVTGGADEAMAVAARVKLFTRATSLGGAESLIEHRASVEGPETRTPQNLLRLSVGLEHPDDLIADLAQALA